MDNDQENSENTLQSREQELLRAFKEREERAFFAMIVLGLFLSNGQYFGYWFFFFFAIFGIFQINYMNLINVLAVKKDITGSNGLQEQNGGNLRGGFLSGVSNGVLGNFVWWLLLVVAAFSWQQFNPQNNINESDKTIVESSMDTSIEDE